MYAIGGATGIAVNDTVSLGGFTIPGQVNFLNCVLTHSINLYSRNFHPCQGFASIDNSTTVATAGGNNGLLGFGWAGISK